MFDTSWHHAIVTLSQEPDAMCFTCVGLLLYPEDVLQNLLFHPKLIKEITHVSIQITATSVGTLRGGAEACPHVAAIQITTDNTVFGGLGGAGVGTEAISWGKESPSGRNVMVFADLTIEDPPIDDVIEQVFADAGDAP